MSFRLSVATFSTSVRKGSTGRWSHSGLIFHRETATVNITAFKTRCFLLSRARSISFAASLDGDASFDAVSGENIFFSAATSFETSSARPSENRTNDSIRPRDPRILELSLMFSHGIIFSSLFHLSLCPLHPSVPRFTDRRGKGSLSADLRARRHEQKARVALRLP